MRLKVGPTRICIRIVSFVNTTSAHTAVKTRKLLGSKPMVFSANGMHSHVNDRMELSCLRVSDYLSRWEFVMQSCGCAKDLWWWKNIKCSTTSGKCQDGNLSENVYLKFEIITWITRYYQKNLSFQPFLSFKNNEDFIRHSSLYFI
jgi:hypothetical protein